MRILIVDDHAVVRQGLRRLLAAEAEHTLAEAADGLQALALAETFRPHLTILDLNMPGLAGLELLKRMVDAGRGRVLVLSMLAEPHFVRRALQVGAHGYVTKHADPAELLEAINRVRQGGRYVDPEVAQALALDDDAADSGLFEQLSMREVEILRLLGQGSTLAEIGAALGVSYKTVANNCALIKSKLRVTRTADLLRLVMDSGLGPSLRP
jgi:DNA-binding NarL/FixJ family response regulator